MCIAANRQPNIIEARLSSSNNNLPKALKTTFDYSAKVNCKIINPNKLGIIVNASLKL